ncbi:MAG: hypothetical protein ACPGRC_07430 [Salibacteraceae bacterium]
MKILWNIVFAISLLTFFGCEKNEIKKWTVQYKVENRGIEVATYRMIYQLRGGATKSVGPLTDRIWESEILGDFESGTPVQIEMEILSGAGKYDVSILRDGAIHEKETLEKGEVYLLIESEI